ncbi:GIY-YIG nuclease family protein [Rubrivivax albus]|uniref:GIY-YIG nuclease family protein n=1 Tax=Rubrivivax albus TaxID=2499835 RepID=A0A437K127_9BURK|nr:GIY-YIG nuclease family protein [Rubrivivax albus]RVT53975.1 GIY-YIG nuclease family protein [Rubrivivax albus]
MAKFLPVIVAGQPFPTLKAAASHFGVHTTTAARRLREGWTPEQAFGVAARQHASWPAERSANLSTSAGHFRTLEDAAKHFGINYGTLTKRLREGWTHDEAVGLVPRQRPPKLTQSIIVNGVTYPNVEAFADAFGLNRIRVRQRLARGWTAEQSVDLAPAPPRYRDPDGKERSHVWKQVDLVDNRIYPGATAESFKLYVIRNNLNGKQYIGITVSPLAERLRGHRAGARNGLSSKLYSAMRKYGIENFSIELIRNDAQSFVELQEQEIAEIRTRNTIRNGYNTTPGGSIGSSERVTVAGVTYPSRGAAAEHFGVDVSVFNLRIARLGWTPEQAAEIETRPKHARRRISVGDHTFPTLKAASEAFGLDYKTVHRRVTVFGWSNEEALGLAPPPSRGTSTGVQVHAFGQAYPSIAACARAHGIKPDSLRRRTMVVGEDVESAISALQELRT